MMRLLAPVSLPGGQRLGPGEPPWLYLRLSEQPESGRRERTAPGMLLDSFREMVRYGIRGCVASLESFQTWAALAVQCGLACGLEVRSLEELATVRGLLATGSPIAFLRLLPDALAMRVPGREPWGVAAVRTGLPLFMGTGTLPWPQLEAGLGRFPVQAPLVLVHGDGLTSVEGSLWNFSELSSRYEIPIGFASRSASHWAPALAAADRGAAIIEREVPGWTHWREATPLGDALAALRQAKAPQPRPVIPCAGAYQPMTEAVFPAPFYDLSAIPLTELVLCMVEYRHISPKLALNRLETYGLPPVVVQDALTHCDVLMLDRFTDARLRDPARPLEDRNIIGMVLARGGSKGLPGKALRKLGGKSLVGWAVEHCLAVRGVGRVLINTDSPRIAEEAVKHGAQALFLRPSELATDTASPTWADTYADYWLRMSEGYVYDYRVIVSATHPLIRPEEISRGLEELHRSGAFWTLSQAPGPKYARSFMLSTNEGGLAAFPLDAAPPAADIVTRSGAFSVSGRAPFRHMSRPFQAEERRRAFRPPSIWHAIPAEQAIDVDTYTDLVFARLLHARLRSVQRANEDDVLRHVPFRNSSLSRRATCGPCGVLVPESTLKVGKIPGVCRVLDMARALFGEDIYVIGKGALAEACAVRYDCSLLPWFREGGGRSENASRLPDVRLLLQGNAVFLRTSTLLAFADAVAETPELALASVSTPAIHPYLLQWNSTEGAQPATRAQSGRRQAFPDVVVRDGVLEWHPANDAGEGEARGFRLSPAEGVIASTPFELLRGMALSAPLGRLSNGVCGK